MSGQPEYHPSQRLSLQSQRVGRRMFVSFLLIGVFPILASVGILSIANLDEDPWIKYTCIGVIIAAVCVIGVLAFKILYDIVTTFLAASNRIRALAEESGAAYNQPLTPRRKRTERIERLPEGEEISIGLNKITDRLRQSMDELHSKARELELTNLQLKRLDRLKSDFLSSVSHELRTPLTSIRSFSEILLTYENEDPETRRRFLTIINQESERLTNLINDVLDLSKIEAGRTSWNMEILSPREVAENARKTIEPLARSRQIRLALEAEPELPRLFGDRDRLVQVVINLLSNAVKFSHQGGTVELRLRPDPDPQGGLIISVRDEGIGIPADKLKSIFDKFVQIHSRETGKPPGTGLGLAICKDIAELLGGRIEVESELDQGSTFRVYLPAWQGGDRFASLLDWKRHQAAILNRPLSLLLLQFPGGDLSPEEVSQLSQEMQTGLREHDLVAAYPRRACLGVVLMADKEGALRISGRLRELLEKVTLPNRPALNAASLNSALLTEVEMGADSAALCQQLEEKCPAAGAGS